MPGKGRMDSMERLSREFMELRYSLLAYINACVGHYQNAEDIMGDKIAYNCKKCGKKVEQAEEEKNIPDCCEGPMEKEPLPVCETTETAEHARLDGADEPCDDGRSG